MRPRAETDGLGRNLDGAAVSSIMGASLPDTGAEVAELADALASGASGLNARAGSSPVLGTLETKDLRQLVVSSFGLPVIRFGK